MHCTDAVPGDDPYQTKEKETRWREKTTALEVTWFWFQNFY